MIDRITQLAIEIADSAASSDIECYCNPVGGEPQTVEALRTCFYDIADLSDAEVAPCVATAVEYLAGRGLLHRHPENQNWVRPIHENELVEAA